MTFPPLQAKSLVFDIETAPAKKGQPARILMIGAMRTDSDAVLEIKVGDNPRKALQQLDDLAMGADVVLGHNVLAHDLPILHAHEPDMVLHALPVIDTLRLSPLAFPQNPYHRLVKDYKLIRDSLNSPLSDCRSTWSLFQDQAQAFSQLHAKNPLELRCYQALLASRPLCPLNHFFSSLTGLPPVGISELGVWMPQLLQETDASLQRDLKVCRTRLMQLLEEDVRHEALRWPLAYVLAWLRVSGGNSVMAPWVRHQFPDAARLISELRDMPCTDEACQYCRVTHDPHRELKRYFVDYDDFRYEKPGESLQRNIVLAGMQSKHVLAILATGGGKSVCYQLPALNRFHRNGSLSIIISPLQSLMKDQVDGLLAKNVQCVAALNGLLTMPERADVLEKVQMGDIGILLVSPEQFRNKAFRRAISQRQVGAWVFDEAHCLSKWGSDFRPDYLYVSRFIREYTGAQPLAPIGCFTATAKLDVLADIRGHFSKNLGVTFAEFPGGHERKNLNFDVMPCLRAEKWARTDSVLSAYLKKRVAGSPIADDDTRAGGAVVFVASRKGAEELSDFLIGARWLCQHFHAGLTPSIKTGIQNDFKSGALQVIVATNAFGMGVDKSDIRVVIHADIPGSLENYLQEAGRAGRDQADAQCVLLYDPQDVETQFGLSERAKLTIRDVQQILRKLRMASQRRKDGSLIITAGEILLDEAVDTSFSADERDAETKVVTAIAWLERGDYLKREENHTQIFPARLDLTIEAAEQRLQQAQLSARRLAEFRAILHFLYQTQADARVNTDQLMQLTSLASEEVAGVLKQLEALGVLINDSQLTLYLTHGVKGASAGRLEDTLALEQALFQCLREQAPDAEQGEWQDLHLPPLTATLKAATAQAALLPLHVLRLLRSLSGDHDASGQQRSSFELRQLNRDYLKLRIRGGHSWRQIENFGERRRHVARVLMPFLIGKLPPGVRRKDLLVETSFGELVRALEADLMLPHLIPPDQRRKAVEHVLLYMHRQDILTLNHGMTVMRRAMTIVVNPEDKRKTFLKEDFQRLDEHYRERRIQVHVMREYAEIARESIKAAQKLVFDYFSEAKQTFIKRYFAGREEVLKLATSEQSWSDIVRALSPVQKQIVVDDDDTNRLVLAGPGSGKTRVIVHRIAYLLRVRRVPATSIVALTFNRHAANEIRRRLLALVGAEAYGVSVLTYHRMAMRLTGTRFERGEVLNESALKQVLEDAAELLEGTGRAEGDDDLREQLLSGYRYILVDEYQDIDALQYRLVSALAGRHTEEEGRLCILAVGDDDQNIYAWRDTSNRYIEQFCEDYGAVTSFLVDNYRSSQRIIGAANQLIDQNPERLKRDHPIAIDEARQSLPAGGVWESLDVQRRGQVLRLVIDAGSDEQGMNLQAQAAVAELTRLLAMEQGGWGGCAILARAHRYLRPIQSWCEQHDVPYFLAADKGIALPMVRQRGFVAVIDYLRHLDTALHAMHAQQALREANLLVDEVWAQFFDAAFEQLLGEWGDCPIPGHVLVDWLYDYARELREQPSDGLYLGTVHSAKGLEFRHVVLLDGEWNNPAHKTLDERRLYYVGMTRAEQTLTLCEFTQGNPFSRSLASSAQQQTFYGIARPELNMSFQPLALTDVDLGYAGRHAAGAPIHRAISDLRKGSPLVLQRAVDHYHLLDGQGNVVGRTARVFQPSLALDQYEVAAVVVRYAEDSAESFRRSLKSDRWEVVVPMGRSRVAS